MPKLIGYTGWNDEHTHRVLYVGHDSHIKVAETDDGATLHISGATAVMSASEMQYMASALLSWFGFHGLPGEEEDDPLAASIKHIAHVQDELENWNVRAREDEEHPPYDKLCTELEEALRRLKRMQEILNAKP